MTFDEQDDDSFAQINITPLVDVVLVLLVIFMVTAPLLQQGIGVELPRVAAKPLDSEVEQLNVLISRDGGVQFNNASLRVDELHQKLSAIVQSQPDCKVALRADKNVPYGQLAEVMAAIRDAGVKKIGMVTEPLKEKR
ncbi:MAG TPA: biopolymer transporter ExbD [Candidatus Binatia bacterium]|nr:biopolymer transporter ExbD [Candidatus Binatia bacterium]